MAEAKKKASTTKRKPLDQRKMTTQRYIDEAEGITVIKRPDSKKKK